MTEITHPFTPDWISPPGDTILDLLGATYQKLRKAGWELVSSPITD